MEPITRQEAVARGLSRYFTGKPCESGHVSERQVGNGTCLGCARSPEYNRVARARAQRPELKAQRQARQRLPTRRAIVIACHHNMPIEIPDLPCPAVCDCCGETSDQGLHLDHCHETGRFRGWCCGGCNTGMGIIDNPRRLRLRAAFLERSFPEGPINWAYPVVNSKLTKSPIRP